MTTSPLTLTGARVVDPILTNHARGYSHPDRIAHVLFPRVSVPVRGFKRIEFGKESFRLYSTRRAPGARTKEIVFGYEGKPASLDQYALDAIVPREHVQEAERGPGINLQMEAVSVVQDVMSLDAEVQAATLATNASNYSAGNKETLSGTDQWDHASSKPKVVINEAKEAVRKKIGREPNTLVLGPGAYRALDDHPAILDKIKYTSSESISLDLLKRYFQVDEVVVGRSIFVEGDESEFTDVWGNYAVLAYVPRGGAASVRVPSYGYTYQLDGHPFAEPMAFDRNRKSWVAGVTDERSPELVGAEAGFLFSSVVSG